MFFLLLLLSSPFINYFVFSNQKIYFWRPFFFSQITQKRQTHRERKRHTLCGVCVCIHLHLRRTCQAEEKTPAAGERDIRPAWAAVFIQQQLLRGKVLLFSVGVSRQTLFARPREKRKKACNQTECKQTDRYINFFFPSKKREKTKIKKWGEK